MKTLLKYLWGLIEYQFPLKVLSLLIGATLWIVVFGSRTIETTKEIPFEVVMSEDQMLIDPVPEKISFRLVGPKAFLRSLNNRIEDPIRANIKELKSGTFTHRIYSDSLKLPLGVKVLSVSPNVVQIKVEELKRKMVNVKLEISGQNALPDQQIVRTEVLPPQMKVKGPKNRLAQLTTLSALPIDISQFKETTIIPLAFDFKALGIEPDSNLPEMNVEIQGKGQAFRVKHVPVKINTNHKASIDDDEVTVIVRTDPGAQVKIDGEQVKAEVDVRDLPSGEFLKWIKVNLPPNVHLVKVVPAFTRVVVREP